MIKYTKPTFDEGINTVLFALGFFIILISDSNLLLALGVALIALHNKFSLGKISIKVGDEK